MKYLLDTNACIRLLKGDSPIMLKHIEKIESTDVCISSIVRFELFYGAYKSAKVEENINKISDFLQNIVTLPVDENSAVTAGKIRADLEKRGTPIGPYDLLIGATAMVNECILITHNTKEFSRVSDLKLEDWEI